MTTGCYSGNSVREVSPDLLGVYVVGQGGTILLLAALLVATLRRR
jgi:hypothetical protein